MFEELAAELTLDAEPYASGAEDAADASEEVAQSADGVSESLFEIDPAGVAAGGALAAVGTAAQGVLDDTQELRESIGRTSTTMGVSSDEANEMARSLSNATFPIGDVTETMDALATQGVTTQDEMETLAQEVDLLADATGTSAAAIAESAGPALRAMGSDIDELGEHMDTFTAVARTTTQDVESFSNMVTRAGPELQELGLSVDETAQIMMALEDQGLSGRQAIREFRQATNEAEGDQRVLYEELGITEKALGEYEQTIASAEGATEEHANAANESLSVMDDLRAGFDDAKLAAGEYLGPMSAAAPALQAVGISAMALSTINVSAVAPSFATVSAAAAPVTAAVLGIAAAAGALYAVWDSNFLGIQNHTQDLVETVTWAMNNTDEAIDKAINAVKRFYPPIRIAREVYDRNLLGIGDRVDWLVENFTDGVDFIIEKALSIPDVLADVIDMIPGVDSEDVLGDIDLDSIKEGLFPPKPEVEAEGEEAGDAARDGVLSEGDWEDTGKEVGEEAASGVREAVSEDAPIEGEMTDSMRTVLEDGVEGYVSDPEEIEDTATQIDENLFDAMASTEKGATAERLGISDQEFAALMDRFGDGGGSTSATTTSSSSPAATGTAAAPAGQSTSPKDIANAVRDALSNLVLEGTLDVDDDEWDRLVEPEVRAVLDDEVDRLQRGGS